MRFLDELKLGEIMCTLDLVVFGLGFKELKQGKRVVRVLMVGRSVSMVR